MNFTCAESRHWIQALATFCCLLLPAAADQYGDFTYTSDGTAITITGYTGVGGDVSIPSSIVELPVTSISASAFLEKTTITSVDIPASVVSIGDSAFNYCSGLTSVNISTGVVSIGDFAFNFCYSLTSVSIPPNVTSIGGKAFSYCASLTSVAIPDSVTSIGKGAFSFCSTMTDVLVDESNPVYSSLDGILLNKAQTELIQCPAGKLGLYSIPPNVTSIGDGAFLSCSGLTSVSIPAGVTSIGEYAFTSCSGLTSVFIPDSVTKIERNQFYLCTAMTDITVDPENQVYSSSNGVLCNKDMTEVIECPAGKSGAYVIPDSVTSIASYAFIDCSGLTSVTIPASVTSIRDWAFTRCSGLTSITIPGSVINIDSYAFHYCSGLNNAIFTGNAPTMGISVFPSSAEFMVYFMTGSTGFTTPTWEGYPSEEFEAGTSRETWRQTYFSTTANTGNAADTADPDKDGVVNLLEFAFGLHPLQNSAHLFPQWQLSGNNLNVTFIQPAGVSGITYGAEWSPTMAVGTWLPLVDTGTTPQHTFTAPMSEGQKFVRLKVFAP